MLAAIACDTATKCRQRQMLHELGKDIATFVHRALPCDGHVARSARIRIPIEIETASKSQFRLPTQNVSLHPTSNVGTALAQHSGLEPRRGPGLDERMKRCWPPFVSSPKAA